MMRVSASTIGARGRGTLGETHIVNEQHVG